MVYARTIEDEILNFGVSGLDRGTLVLYDAESRARQGAIAQIGQLLT